jgi:hypothetical protein
MESWLEIKVSFVSRTAQERLETNQQAQKSCGREGGHNEWCKSNNLRKFGDWSERLGLFVTLEQSRCAVCLWTCVRLWGFLWWGARMKRYKKSKSNLSEDFRCCRLYANYGTCLLVKIATKYQLQSVHWIAHPSRACPTRKFKKINVTRPEHKLSSSYVTNGRLGVVSSSYQFQSFLSCKVKQ